VDFLDSPQEAEFRREVSAWLDSALEDQPYPVPADQAQREVNGRWWHETLYAGGWAGITWPEEYGGRGLSVVHQAIFFAEEARHGAPVPVGGVGLVLVGPTLLVHGTEEQKKRYLPPMLSGDEVWCQGFSEPGSGSDLASLRTRAVPADNGFVLEGQKVWTTFGHLADRCLLLARVDDAASTDTHAGITCLLAPMARADVRPLRMVNGDSEFNEVFWTGVHVDAADVLGEVGRGWPVALTTLGFERGSLALVTSVSTRRAMDALVGRVRAVGADTDPVVRDRIGALEATVTALRVGGIRTMSEVQAGRAPGPEGSTLKLAWAHVMQDITRLGVQVAGAAGVVDDGAAGGWLYDYLRARGNSIEGGTDEVQRSIIAERVLGLPRSR
jgi:alkylation response protein AidB-like acyl-CoA dehydrogenase